MKGLDWVRGIDGNTRYGILHTKKNRTRALRGRHMTELIIGYWLRLHQDQSTKNDCIGIHGMGGDGGDRRVMFPTREATGKKGLRIVPRL